LHAPPQQTTAYPTKTQAPLHPAARTARVNDASSRMKKTAPARQYHLAPRTRSGSMPLSELVEFGRATAAGHGQKQHSTTSPGRRDPDLSGTCRSVDPD